MVDFRLYKWIIVLKFGKVQHCPTLESEFDTPELLKATTWHKYLAVQLKNYNKIILKRSDIFVCHWPDYTQEHTSQDKIQVKDLYFPSWISHNPGINLDNIHCNNVHVSSNYLLYPIPRPISMLYYPYIICRCIFLHFVIDKIP